MATWIVPPIAGLTDANIVPEIVAEGIGGIAIKNGRVTIYLYDEQMPLEPGNGKAMRVVTGKIVGELSNVPACVAQLAMCLVGARVPGLAPEPEPFDGLRAV
jgi:hypothetical protein